MPAEGGCLISSLYASPKHKYVFIKRKVQPGQDINTYISYISMGIEVYEPFITWRCKNECRINSEDLGLRCSVVSLTVLATKCCFYHHVARVTGPTDGELVLDQIFSAAHLTRKFSASPSSFRCAPRSFASTFDRCTTRACHVLRLIWEVHPQKAQTVRVSQILP